MFISYWLQNWSNCCKATDWHLSENFSVDISHKRNDSIIPIIIKRFYSYFVTQMLEHNLEKLLDASEGKIQQIEFKNKLKQNKIPRHMCVSVSMKLKLNWFLKNYPLCYFSTIRPSLFNYNSPYQDPFLKEKTFLLLRLFFTVGTKLDAGQLAGDSRF